MTDALARAATAIAEAADQVLFDPNLRHNYKDMLPVAGYGESTIQGPYLLRLHEALIALRAALSAHLSSQIEKAAEDVSYDRKQQEEISRLHKHINAQDRRIEALEAPLVSAPAEEPQGRPINDMLIDESSFIKSVAKEIDNVACEYKMALQRAFHAGYARAPSPTKRRWPVE